MQTKSIAPGEVSINLSKTDIKKLEWFIKEIKRNPEKVELVREIKKM